MDSKVYPHCSTETRWCCDCSHLDIPACELPDAARMADAVKRYRVADQERMAQRPSGYPRAAWRMATPIDVPFPEWTIGRVRISPDAGNPRSDDMWVWSRSDRNADGTLVLYGHLDLTSDAADYVLSHLERARTRNEIRTALETFKTDLSRI